MRRLYRDGLTTDSGGNASVRLEGGSMLITPSGPCKGEMRGEDIGVVDIDGAENAGGAEEETGAENGEVCFRPSMETGMHSAIYRQRNDVNAIIHAHPLFATAYTATGREIRYDLTAEARAILGQPARVTFRIMGGPELADSVGRTASKTDVILLDNHGVVVMGRSLSEAFGRIELIESTAKISFITEILGDTKALDSGQLRLIDELFGNDGERSSE